MYPQDRVQPSDTRTTDTENVVDLGRCRVKEAKHKTPNERPPFYDFQKRKGKWPKKVAEGLCKGAGEN